MRDQVDAVVLDVGGIFFLPDPELIAGILTEHGLEVPDEATFHRAHYVAAFAYDHGSNVPEQFDDYIAAFVTELGVALDHLPDAHDAVIALFADPGNRTWSWVQRDTADALARLHEMGIPLAIVSNANGTVEEVLLEKAVCQVGDGDGVPVATVVDSTVVGVQKPDPAIFTFALDALGVDPARAVYVGDTHKNDVTGALAAGMVPVLLDPYDLYTRYDGEFLRVRSLGDLADLLSAPA
jgi:HAD superfamily hydrolase (TIGR01662 family)